MPFQIGGGHDWSGVREFMYDVDGPAFLKKDLVWIDTSSQRSRSYKWTVPSHTFWEHLTYFSNVKGIISLKSSWFLYFHSDLSLPWARYVLHSSIFNLFFCHFTFSGFPFTLKTSKIDILTMEDSQVYWFPPSYQWHFLLSLNISTFVIFQ